MEPDLSLWITTYSTSRKVDQIKKNPNICLAFVEQPKGDKAATVIGKAKIINDMQQKKRIWDLAPFDISQHFPEGAASKEYCLLKIVIKKIEWRDGWTGKLNTFQP